MPPNLCEGLYLNWGNIGTMEKLVHTIARRDTKLGDILSHGVGEAAKRIGNGTEKFAYAVKNLSRPAMDPRGFKATGLAVKDESLQNDEVCTVEINLVFKNISTAVTPMY